jgi:hypothetical protein
VSPMRHSERVHRATHALMVYSQIIRTEYSEPQIAARRAIHIGVGQDADLSASRYAWDVLGSRTAASQCAKG